jgi:hypothetical protein
LLHPNSSVNFQKSIRSGLATSHRSPHIRFVRRQLITRNGQWLGTAALVFVLGGLVSCRILPERKNEAPAASPAPSANKLPIGVVELVDGDGGFVLIKSSRFITLDPETILDVMGDGGVVTAQVKVSPARKGQFLTADIVSGLPVKGQSVLSTYQSPNPTNPAQNGSASPGAGGEVQVLE